MSIKNQVQLITYPDSLGGDLKALLTILLKYFSQLFPGGVHVLPPFPSSGDRGFAPISYFEIDPHFGSWEDIREIAESFDILIDLMVNHLSRQSLYFQDFLRKGRRSAYADLFITLDKVWPGGIPPSEDVARIFLRKPEQPFSDIQIEESGEWERVWTTFGTRDWSEQIDVDVTAPATRDLYADILAHFSRQGIKIVRLDAIAYAIKKPGTSCFFIEPEIYDFLAWIRHTANSLGMEILPEVHAHPSIQARLAGHGYWVYNFVLPLLILHTLVNRSSLKLREHLKTCPHNQFTMLDCHDGIPVLPDIEGVLTVAEAQKVVDHCLQHGANLSHILSTQHKSGADFDAHQINCSYYSALDRQEDAYLAARAIQFFSPGTPQVYYVGLLAGENDLAAVEHSGERRAINRHNFTLAEVDQAMQKPVVQRLMRLIEFRNSYPAFNGHFEVIDARERQLWLGWQKEIHQCMLKVDLDGPRTVIEYLDEDGQVRVYQP